MPASPTKALQFFIIGHDAAIRQSIFQRLVLNVNMEVRGGEGKQVPGKQKKDPRSNRCIAYNKIPMTWHPKCNVNKRVSQLGSQEVIEKKKEWPKRVTNKDATQHIWWNADSYLQV